MYEATEDAVTFSIFRRQAEHLVSGILHRSRLMAGDVSAFCGVTLPGYCRRSARMTVLFACVPPVRKWTTASGNRTPL
jgi:hypothetical protein